jgi:hypothetical protein
MAKKTKDTATSTKKEVKPKAPVDPIKTRQLIRLLNILALLLAITAFLLQLFAVLTHHWKWQKTDLRALVSPTYHYAQPNLYEDSRLDQNYGLYSREVKIYGNNDEQVDLWASTRFPRPDEGDDQLHHCLSRTTTIRGAYLTCSGRVISPNECHCRRYAYWNFVIFFEILALILLGIAVIVTALLTTQFHDILRLAGAGVALLAFLLLLISLILILSHLKRETRTIADAYPHIHQRISDKLGIVHDPHRAAQRYPTVLHQAVRRQMHETYRAYPLSPGQHPYNDTHFQEYSEQARSWVYTPYTSLPQPAAYVPQAQRDRPPFVAVTKRPTTAAPTHNVYGPLIGYNDVFEHTHAGIGWSTVLSILAMILSLLLPLLLIFAWLTNKKLGPNTKTVTSTTVTTEYKPIPQEVVVEKVHGRSIPTDYDHNRPIGDAVVTAQNVRQGEPVIVRDVVIRDEHPPARTTEEHTFPVNVESTQHAHA